MSEVANKIEHEDRILLITDQDGATAAAGSPPGRTRVFMICTCSADIASSGPENVVELTEDGRRALAAKLLEGLDE